VLAFVVLNPGRVLIIEDDPWTASVLAKFLRERGHDVFLCGDARSGFDKACEWMPDCIVCNVTLPDIDGFWVARRVRTEPSAVATTPFLFVMSESERESRIQALHVGADAYLTRPFSNDEAVAQVEALIEMARRLRVRRDSFVSEAPTNGRGAAFRGDIAQMALSTVLMVLGMERRSGRLRIMTEGHTAELLIAADTFAAGELNGEQHPPLEVLRVALKWKKGTFYFRPTSDATPDMRGSISALLLEAMQLEDELAASKK
jgi:two-component system, OmpR family, response regulator